MSNVYIATSIYTYEADWDGRRIIGVFDSHEAARVAAENDRSSAGEYRRDSWEWCVETWAVNGDFVESVAA